MENSHNNNRYDRPAISFVERHKVKIAMIAAIAVGTFQLGRGGETSSQAESLEADYACEIDPNVRAIVPEPVIHNTHDHENPAVTEAKEKRQPAKSFSLIHNVEQGQTLSDIASCYFKQPELGLLSIQAANPDIKDANKIADGQKITINISSAVTFELDKDISVEQASEITGYPQETLKSINRLEPGEGNLSERVSLPIQRAVIADDRSEIVIVQPGQTLSGIARNAGVPLVALINLNGENYPENPDNIMPGSILLVPASQRSTAEAPPGESPYVAPEVKIKEFLNQYDQLAQQAADKYGLPKDAILAQAILESGYGSSELSISANNFFGIKADSSWDGPIYDKLTLESIDPKQLDAYESARIIEELDDGRLMIEVSQPFRMYSDAAQSFDDYGRKTTGSDFYVDALELDDPYEYIRKLTDDHLPKYATDPEYLIKVFRILDNLNTVRQLPDEEDPDEVEAKGSIERINSIELTLEGYEEFVRNIDRSYMEFASSKSAFNGSTGSPEFKPFEFLTLHFTTLYVNEDGRNNQQPIGNFSPERLIRSMDNQSGDSCCGVQWTIGRDATTYQLTDKDTRTKHNPPYDSVSSGVEIEAVEQDDITKAQYEAAAYLSLYVLVLEDKLKPGVDISSRVVGHGEIREVARELDESLNIRTDFPAQESAAFRAMIEKFIASNDKIIEEIIRLSKG